MIGPAVDPSPLGMYVDGGFVRDDTFKTAAELAI